MSSTWGNKLKISIFGESHSKGIGIVIDGIPAGTVVDFPQLLDFMGRRSSKGGSLDTARIEADFPQIQSGLLPDVNNPNLLIACGTPICAVIENNNTRSKDYDKMRSIARPGHADYTGFVRYNGFNDIRGGGHFSGRLTAPLCFAGAVAVQFLRSQGIEVGAHIASVAGIADKAFDPVSVSAQELREVTGKFFPVLDEMQGQKMQDRIRQAKEEQDSVGGIIECAAVGLSAGLGSPMFDCVESKISSIIFGIPAVKGIEFGSGFGFAEMMGSQSNDPFCIKDGAVKTTSNHNGGILGGITNSMPLIFRTVIKPTPSIGKIQDTVNFMTGENTQLSITGRHDPCIVRRAVPCIESAAAIALMDILLG